MLIEALLSLTALTRLDLRRLGLVGGAVGLWSRGRRQQAAWADHNARTRAFIAAASAGVAERRTVLVLGSGLLRDVPLADLVRDFRRVVLVDAVHLWPARRACRDPKVEHRVVDLSGVAAWLTGGAEGRVAPLADLAADPEIDFVASANVLSQLPYAPERWLERRPALADRLPADLPARIVRWHLHDLAAFRGRVCLVSDVGFQDVAPDGRVELETDLARGVALPPADDAWDWTVAPRGEIDRRLAYRHQVRAWRDIGPALRAGISSGPTLALDGRP